MGQNFERLALSRLGREPRRRQIDPADTRLLDPGVGKRDGARRLLRRLHRPPARPDFRARRDFAVGRFSVGLDLISGDIAGDNDDRVIRRVEAPVEGQGVVAGELFDFGPPADHRTAIRMVEVERRIHLLGQPAVGVIRYPHVLLFEHHVELGTHDLVGEHKAGDAVGFERHHFLEVLARNALEKAGIIIGGEGILLPADVSHGLQRTGCRGSRAVPLNIRCSRKCARPDFPAVSSAPPTLYQIIWVTTGAR